jgi:hypothetical protein
MSETNFFSEISKIYYKYHIIYTRHSTIAKLYAYVKDSFLISLEDDTQCQGTHVIIILDSVEAFWIVSLYWVKL